jgi:hypothetical protein
MPTMGFSRSRARQAHRGAVVASNRTRDIRPSGIIGRLWDTSTRAG